MTDVRDGMRIDWDVAVKMDDGLTLRADVFRPVDEGKHPVILSYGPYGKWLHFEDLYSDQWRRMVEQHPDVAAGSTNKYQNWEVVDPEKWVPDGYVCVRVDSRGAGCSPATSISGPRARRRTSTTASSGQRASPGRAARSVSTASLTTR